MRASVLLASAISAGVALTLLTGLHDATPPGLLGAEWYGLPLTWIRRLVIAPDLYPWVVDYVGLIADLAFWTFLAGILSLLVNRAAGK